MGQHFLAFLSLLLIISGDLRAQEFKSLETIILKPHEDVRIEFQQMRENGSRHGFYQMYHRNTLIVKGKYVGGKKHGKWKRFYQNGKPHIEAFYIQDKRHGNWNYFYQDGRMMAQISFNQDEKVGMWKSYYYDGFLNATYSHPSDSNLAEQCIYYPSKDLEPGAAQPQLQRKTVLRDGFQDIEKYYNNGKIYKRYTIKDKLFRGPYESFYYTGIPWERMNFEEDGRLFSIYDYNNPVGRDADRGTFRDGNGILNMYNGDGMLFSTLTFFKGFPDGKLTVFEEGGKVLISGFFNDNVRTGTWRYYKPIISKSELFGESNFIGVDSAHTVQYFSDQQARQEGNYYKYKRFGLWSKYNAYGELIETTEYVNGFKNGQIKGFRSGNLAMKGNYYYDIKVGNWSYYNDNIKLSYSEDFSTDVYADVEFLSSDSVGINSSKERMFYDAEKFLARDEKRWSYITLKDLFINFDSPLFEGQYSTGPGFKYQAIEPEVEEYSEDFKPYFPQFIPWEVDVRQGVVKDIDEGLFIETLNPRKVKVKGDKSSPKLGVAMVILYLDEFGAVTRKKLVRGANPEWDDKILALFDDYAFWEPAALNNLPMACSLQLKIPLEIELVKKL